MFLSKRGASFHLKNGQLESLFIMVLPEFENPFNGLHLIKIILKVEIAIKLLCLNLEATKVIYWMPSSSNAPIFIIFMRTWIGDINVVDIKLQVARGPTFRFFNLLKLHGEFSYLILKNDNGIFHPHFMGFSSDMSRGWEGSPLLAIVRSGQI